MTLSDQELLDKQLRIAPRHDGIIMLAILAIFFTGMALGGFLSAYSSKPSPMQIASNDITSAISASPQGQILRQ
jgi:hypothetical protein